LELLEISIGPRQRVRGELVGERVCTRERERESQVGTTYALQPKCMRHTNVGLPGRVLRQAVVENEQHEGLSAVRPLVEGREWALRHGDLAGDEERLGSLDEEVLGLCTREQMQRAVSDVPQQNG